jgi:hypothetical protein
MGARLNNTGRDRNVGFVEHALRLDIRELRKRGDLFIDDELCGIVLEDTGIAVETDLTSPTFPWIKVIFPDGTASGRVQTSPSKHARPSSTVGAGSSSTRQARRLRSCTSAMACSGRGRRQG